MRQEILVKTFPSGAEGKIVPWLTRKKGKERETDRERERERQRDRDRQGREKVRDRGRERETEIAGDRNTHRLRKEGEI